MTDFDRLLQQIDDEASAEGPEGLRDLETLRARLDLAVQLIARRRQLGLTQAQLAAASGIAQAVISRKTSVPLSICHTVTRRPISPEGPVTSTIFSNLEPY